MSYQLNQEERQIYLKYSGLNLPRHTSYPIAPAWSPEFKERSFSTSLRALKGSQEKFSLYFHVPFCQQLCFYCGCNKEIKGRDLDLAKQVSDRYIEHLALEMAQVAQHTGPLLIGQIHLGGGSPTYLSADHLTKMRTLIDKYYEVAEGAEIAIELDPRISSEDQIHCLKQLGFNRVSLGVQDFDEKVQRAVNRFQPYELVAKFVEVLRKHHFDSVNFDLIYGLPFQNKESMQETLAKVVSLNPDRIAFYRLAMIPEMFKWQKSFTNKDMPDGELVLDLFLLAHQIFTASGYQYIGFDHFAKAEEDLVHALATRKVQRNFQGITTGRSLSLIGFGPSAISHLEDCYAQNVKKFDHWCEAVQLGLATERGLKLSEDDKIRAELLQEVYCYGSVSFKFLEDKFGISFANYFEKELESLSPLIADGLVSISSDTLFLTEPLGRLLARVPAVAFDKYFNEITAKAPQAGRKNLFSTVG